MILLDTNVVSALMRLAQEPSVQSWLVQQAPDQLITSAPTVFEIEDGIAKLPMSRRRSALQAASHHVLASMLGNRVLPFDRQAAILAARARATQRQRGVTAQIPDNQIAGIAMALSLPIATRDSGGFRHLGLPLIDPWR